MLLIMLTSRLPYVSGKDVSVVLNGWSRYGVITFNGVDVGKYSVIFLFLRIMSFSLSLILVTELRLAAAWLPQAQSNEL